MVIIDLTLQNFSVRTLVSKIYSMMSTYVYLVQKAGLGTDYNVRVSTNSTHYNDQTEISTYDHKNKPKLLASI